MIVLIITNCPSFLRGDLTKWLFEIDTNVFVGKTTARVRDELWDRVVRSCKNGRAVMVFSADNEQRFDFRVHNNDWIPTEYDGLKLIKYPIHDKNSASLPIIESNASKFRKAKYRSERGTHDCDEYVSLHITTDGLSQCDDKIVSICALIVKDHSVVGTYSKSVVHEVSSDQKNEIDYETDLRIALDGLITFIGKRPIVLANAEYTMGFLDTVCSNLEMDGIYSEIRDVQNMAKKRLYNLKSHCTDDLAEFFKIEGYGEGDLSECRRVMKIYEKLIDSDTK